MRSLGCRIDPGDTAEDSFPKSTNRAEVELREITEPRPSSSKISLVSCWPGARVSSLASSCSSESVSSLRWPNRTRENAFDDFTGHFGDPIAWKALTRQELGGARLNPPWVSAGVRSSSSSESNWVSRR